MKILKFGGTSLGTPERMKQVAGLISEVKGKRLIVLSAISGTTNNLVAIGEYLAAGSVKEADKIFTTLDTQYSRFIQELFQGNEEVIAKNQAFKNQLFEDLRLLSAQPYSSQTEKMLLAQGEVLSTKFFLDYLQLMGQSCEMIMAQEFMTLDANAEPDMEKSGKKLASFMQMAKSAIIVTQGYIARNADGGIDNLRRGGSDYTATIVGALLKAEEVQIWTDIDGMHNNDPRIVRNTKPLAKLSFEEASELAYFGAKVLHPHCIIPAQLSSVPVRIKNTMDPLAHGTLISSEKAPEIIKAIAAKDQITAIKIKSSRMVMAYGFLKKIFEVFEKYRTPIDMITTSEIAVSLTIDNSEYLEDIVKEISVYGTVEIDHNQTIVCIVGDLIAERKGVGKTLFNALDEIPLRMISYGGSRNNISILISEKDKNRTLEKLHEALF